jgi:hypothetical protein
MEGGGAGGRRDRVMNAAELREALLEFLDHPALGKLARAQDGGDCFDFGIAN